MWNWLHVSEHFKKINHIYCFCFCITGFQNCCIRCAFKLLYLALKPLHTIGKVSVNASILHKNQEICNKTNLWKFHLISLFLLRENCKNAFSIFLMAGVCVSRDENSLLDLISLIIWKRYQAEIFQGKLSTTVIFIPCKLCINLWTF